MNKNQTESKPASVEEPRDEGITRQVTTFAEWYESKIGVTLEQAKRAGVYDLALLEEAFNFLPNVQEHPTADAAAGSRTQPTK